jgi:hypothetical protein
VEIEVPSLPPSPAEAVFVPPAPEALVHAKPKPTFDIIESSTPPPPPRRGTPMVLPKKPKQEPTATAWSVAPPMDHGWSIVPAHQPPKPVVSIAEPRLRAAQRMQEALKAAKVRKPVPFHGAAFQFASSKQGLYQRPRPEIVQPRLPRMIV